MAPENDPCGCVSELPPPAGVDMAPSVLCSCTRAILAYSHSRNI